MVHHKYYLKWGVIIPPIAIITTAFVYLNFKDLVLTLVWAASVPIGYLIGAYLNPDSDQISVTLGEGMAMRRFKIFGVLFVAYWTIYAYIMQMVGGHRSFWTHFPYISTFIRMMYGLIPFWVWFFYTKSDLYYWEIVAFCGVWVGLGISDNIHYYLDINPRTE